MLCGRNRTIVVLTAAAVVLISAAIPVLVLFVIGDKAAGLGSAALWLFLATAVIGIAIVVVHVRAKATLVLTIPNCDGRGERAIQQLRSSEPANLGCSYIDALIDRVGPESRVRLLEHRYGYHLVSVRRGDEMAAANRILSRHNGESEEYGLVIGAEPNELFTLSGIGVPLKLDGNHAQYLRQMKLDQRSADDTGAGIRIAIIDSGLCPRAGIAQASYLEAGPYPVPGDHDGHGTAMATLINAVAPNAMIQAVRATGKWGNVTLWDLLAAIPMAAYDCRAHIINLSLGLRDIPLECPGCGATFKTRMVAFQKMLEGIEQKPFSADGPPIYVAATGNEGCTTAFNFPAADLGIVAVGSVNSAGARSSFSNYGTVQHKWYLMAPGGELRGKSVTECVGTGPEGKCFGTSPATAYVSGVLALLRSQERYRSKRRDDFLDKVMRDNCEPAIPANPEEYGAGQIVYTRGRENTNDETFTSRLRRGRSRAPKMVSARELLEMTKNPEQKRWVRQQPEAATANCRAQPRFRVRRLFGQPALLGACTISTFNRQNQTSGSSGIAP